MLRKDHEPPAATSAHGWWYHHLGIPTDVPRLDNGAPVELLEFRRD